MRFETSDAWLLEAIKFSENGDKGASLTDIIQAADQINHALMTNSEFVTGLRKLKATGLIVEKNKKLHTTDKFNEWWTTKYGEKSRIYLLKAMEEIEKYLNKTYGTMEEATARMNTEITDSDLDKATDEYIKLASVLVGKLTINRNDK